MKLYIQVEDNKPINHPAFEDNLLQAYPQIPSNWEEFVRVPRPDITLYQVLENESAIYEKVNGVWTDVWKVRDMTNEEKLALQQQVKDQFAARPYASNYSAWVFNEASCTYDPPIPYPQTQDNVIYAWCGAENNWKEVPQQPEGNYKFNLLTWEWEAL